MAELKPCPCPFCGTDSGIDGKIFKTDKKGVWAHWHIGCILDGFTIRDVEAWNRRAGDGK